MPILFWISLILGLTSCGYRLGYADRSLPGGYTQLAIPVFKNQTKEVGVEIYFSNSLKQEFYRSQIARVIPKSKAPITVEGVIQSVTYEPIGQLVGNDLNLTGASLSEALDDNPSRLPANTVLASQYRIVVTAHLRLRRNSDRKIMWEGLFQDEKVYSAPQVGLPVINSVNPLYNHSDRHRQIALIVKDMMAEAHDRITENF